MYCTQCGHKLPEVAQFCSECGAKTVKGSESINKDSGTAKSNSPTDQKRKEIRKVKEKRDRKAPPKIAPLYLFLAIVGITLILVLLHPWHTGQERPKDFRENPPNSETADPQLNNQTMKITSEYFMSLW